MPTLHIRSKWKSKQISDVVIIVDYQNPTNVWSKGIVKDVYPLRDERIHVADMKTMVSLDNLF